MFRFFWHAREERAIVPDGFAYAGAPGYRTAQRLAGYRCAPSANGKIGV